MRYFTDFKVPVESKIGLMNLFTTITTRIGSHKSGWTKLLKCQLVNSGYTQTRILAADDRIEDFDVIVFDLGAEYKGNLNLFGGLDEKIFSRMNEMLAFNGQLFSWRNDLPDITILDARRKNESTCSAFKNTNIDFVDLVQAKLSTCQVFDHTYKTDKLLIGDSHTPGVWTPEYMIERQDGRTLYSSVRDRLLTTMVPEFAPLDQIKIHMSSIDIRHHICRQSEPEQSVFDMLTMLGGELVELTNKDLIKSAILQETMGIEDESRKLPKTGYYKGTPFFGSWNERNNIRQYFNNKLDEMCTMNNWEVSKYPDFFIQRDGQLKMELMEHPHSVHIAPENYKWDLDNNVQRW